MRTHTGDHQGRIHHDTLCQNARGTRTQINRDAPKVHNLMSKHSRKSVQRRGLRGVPFIPPPLGRLTMRGPLIDAGFTG